MKDKIEYLSSYLRFNVAPVLIDFLSCADLDATVILPANIPIEELNGKYDGANLVQPKWFDIIASTKKTKMLVIDKIDTIPIEEQLKFVELLKYRKVSTFELPEDCVIVVTANQTSKINEGIFSLVAKI